MNSGKVFEKEWKDSMPDSVWYYRFRDGTSSWDQNDKSKTRFQAKNICDCEFYLKPNLFLTELKSYNSISLPFTATLAKSGKSKLDDLIEASTFDGIYAGLIVNFRKVNETYWMDVNVYENLRLNHDKQSLNIDYFRNYGIMIPQKKKRVRYRYDIDYLIKQLSNE